MPPVLRVNSVAVSTARFAYVGKRLQQDDFVQMLCDCGYEPTDILGIQYLPHRQIVVVKFRTQELYSRFLGLETVRVAGVPCHLFDMCSQHTMVSIMGAPFEMDVKDITAILARYGEVKSIRKRMLACATKRHFNCIPDGTWLASMDVKEPIPSYILVQDVQLVIRYSGQAKTCRLCGATNHLARDCTRPGAARPVQDDVDFPSLQEANRALTATLPQQEPPELPAAGDAETVPDAVAPVHQLDQHRPCIIREVPDTETMQQEDQHTPAQELPACDEATEPTPTSANDTPSVNVCVAGAKTPSVNVCVTGAKTNSSQASNVSEPTNTPIPVIRIHPAGSSSAAATRIDKNQKAKMKAKKTPSASGPPSSTTDPKSKMNLRPIRKRHATTETSESPTEDGKEQDPNQFVDLDKNYVVTFNAIEQTDSELT